MGSQFNVSSDRLEKLGISQTTPDLQGEWLNHYMTEASRFILRVSFTPLMSVNIDFSFCKDSKEQSEICIHFIRFYTAILSVIF